MKITKSTRMVAAMCLLASVTPAFADVTEFYNFETLGSTYWSDSYGFTTGGQQDIANNYMDLSFSAGVQGIHTSSGFPAHSGVLEIWQSDITNPNIGIGFGMLANNISFWYTTLDGFTAQAYDANGNLIVGATFAAAANTTGTSGIDSLATLSSGSENIASIVITDDGGLGNFTTLDDLSVSAPDATSTAGLLGLAAVGMLAFRRKIVTQ